jgi:hypothetical protein
MALIKNPVSKLRINMVALILIMVFMEISILTQPKIKPQVQTEWMVKVHQDGTSLQLLLITSMTPEQALPRTRHLIPLTSFNINSDFIPIEELREMNQAISQLLIPIIFKLSHLLKHRLLIMEHRQLEGKPSTLVIIRSKRSNSMDRDKEMRHIIK